MLFRGANLRSVNLKLETEVRSKVFHRILNLFFFNLEKRYLLCSRILKDQHKIYLRFNFKNNKSNKGLIWYICITTIQLKLDREGDNLSEVEVDI